MRARVARVPAPLPGLHCDVRGSGAPLVLLHGLGGSGRDWERLADRLGSAHRLIAVDLPGHGRSPRPPGSLSIDLMAEAVAASLERLGVPAAHVVGLSLGGCVGLALALRAPGRVRTLTLVNAFARLRPAGPRAVARLLVRLGLVIAAPMPVLAAWVARDLFPEPGQRDLYRQAVASLARTPRRSYLACMRALAGFDVRARLAEVACPVLVVAGEGDRTVPRAAQAELAARLPDARLVVVPGSRHVTTHDQPEVFAAILLHFIAARGP
jgi:3-oxoadipate enol-lactonase